MMLRGAFNPRSFESKTERTLPQLLETSFFAALDPAFFIAYINDFFFLVFVLSSSGFEGEASSFTATGTVPMTSGLSMLGSGMLGDSNITELSAPIDGGWDARSSDESSESRRGVGGTSILFRKLTDEG